MIDAIETRIRSWANFVKPAWYAVISRRAWKRIQRRRRMARKKRRGWA